MALKPEERGQTAPDLLVHSHYILFTPKMKHGNMALPI